VTQPNPLVAIRAHFEKFPATVKGAFVLRSADRDPHQVVIRGARVTELSGGGAQPLELQPATLDVAPKLDFFVPFEFPVTEMSAGWYCLETDVDVDGVSEVVRTDRRFAIAWPRATVRRGTVPVDEKVEIEGGPTVLIDHLECAGDSMTVHFSADPVESVGWRLQADGTPVALLDTELEERTGRGRATAYPLLKTQHALTIELAYKRGRATVEIVLP
jgi:hypothetical protein